MYAAVVGWEQRPDGVSQMRSLCACLMQDMTMCAATERVVLCVGLVWIEWRTGSAQLLAMSSVL